VSITRYRRQLGAEATAFRAPIAATIGEVDKGIDPFAVLSRRKDAIEFRGGLPADAADEDLESPARGYRVNCSMRCLYVSAT
jgi:hypothetical protein